MAKYAVIGLIAFALIATAVSKGQWSSVQAFLTQNQYAPFITCTPEAYLHQQVCFTCHREIGPVFTCILKNDEYDSGSSEIGALAPGIGAPAPGVGTTAPGSSSADSSSEEAE